MKASIPFRAVLWGASKTPTRFVRRTQWRISGRPTAFRYDRLTPNYDAYWMNDSDAINSLDREETALWFTSRGDDRLNLGPARTDSFQELDPLIIRVRKPAGDT